MRNKLTLLVFLLFTFAACSLFAANKPVQPVRPTVDTGKDACSVMKNLPKGSARGTIAERCLANVPTQNFNSVALTGSVDFAAGANPQACPDGQPHYFLNVEAGNFKFVDSSGVNDNLRYFNMSLSIFDCANNFLIFYSGEIDLSATDPAIDIDPFSGGTLLLNQPITLTDQNGGQVTVQLTAGMSITGAGGFVDVSKAKFIQKLPTFTETFVDVFKTPDAAGSVDAGGNVTLNTVLVWDTAGADAFLFTDKQTFKHVDR